MAAVQLKRGSTYVSIAICSVWLCSAAIGAGTTLHSQTIYQAPSKIKRYSDTPIYSVPPLTEKVSEHESRLDVLDEQIQNLKKADADALVKADKISGQVESIRDDISTIKGFGVGIGALLGFLQAIQVLLQLKRRREDDDLS